MSDDIKPRMGDCKSCGTELDRDNPNEQEGLCQLCGLDADRMRLRAALAASEAECAEVKRDVVKLKDCNAYYMEKIATLRAENERLREDYEVHTEALGEQINWQIEGRKAERQRAETAESRVEEIEEVIEGVRENVYTWVTEELDRALLAAHKEKR